LYYDPNGAFETLALGETGIDTFAYTVSDNHGATSVATATLVIQGRNDGPQAHDDAFGGSRVIEVTDLDIFVANTTSNEVWLNDGSAVFASNGQAVGTQDSRVVVLGDVDGDGDLDLATAVQGATSSLWLNDGTGRFTGVAGFPADRGDFTSVVFADVDADGDQDLLWGNDQYPGLCLYLNSGTGTFRDVTASQVPNLPSIASDLACFDA
ncbi:MAG: VCBS repeat-containing protein, partial [Xanthomonadales bacterium]|nr:VCBS repeat-containing protein [Xanthomonadales bacterium]